MKKNGKRLLLLGFIFVIAFAVWTWLIQIVDVQPIGQKGTDIGFDQLIKRRSLLKVDCDILFLGIYYVIVIL